MTSTVELTNVVVASSTVTAGGTWNVVIGVEVGVGAGLDLVGKHVTVADHPGMSAFRLSTSASSATANAVLTDLLLDDAAYAFVGDEMAGEVVFTDTNTLTHTVTAIEAVEAGTPTFNWSWLDVTPGSTPAITCSWARLPSTPVDAGVPTTSTATRAQSARFRHRRRRVLRALCRRIRDRGHSAWSVTCYRRPPTTRAVGR
jgi:hypothetical protein